MKLIVISLFVVLQTTVFAQEYYPVGTMWEETVCSAHKDIYNPATDDYNYAKMRSIVTGDSVLNGRTYKVVRMLFVEGGMYCAEGRSPQYLIREQNDSVFSWDSYHGKDMLICTFDWAAGGTYYYSQGWNAGVTRTIGEIKQEKLLDGQLYDYLEFGNELYGNRLGKVYRTIGKLGYGLLETPFISLNAFYPVLTHFERNGQVVYHRDIEAPASFRENRSLFPTGTEWREASYTPGSPVRYDDYAIGEETIVGQKTYRRVLKNGADSGLLVREEGCSVWLLCSEYPEEIKLYDFDWLSFGQPSMEYLLERSCGKELEIDRGINLDDISLWYSSYRNQQATLRGRTIVHDVGCVSGSRRNACIMGYKEPESVETDTTKNMVVWFRRKVPGGTYGYDANVPSDWTVGMSHPDYSTAHTTQGLYDLQGRRVPSLTSSHSPLKKGIYIENGRKRVVR